MQFCQPHWEELKAAIDQRGLSQFIARSGEEAIEHTVRELQGQDTVVDFEPLLMANNMLWNLSMNVIGLEMMAVNEQGAHRCPVCELKNFDYITAAANGVLADAKTRGLITE